MSPTPETQQTEPTGEPAPEQASEQATEQTNEQTTAQVTESVTSADLEALAAQLGRVPRGVVAIAARCVCGRPTVVRTAPRLDDGTPFPTSYYLTHPAAVKGCSTLEAEHLMETFNADLAADEELAAAYAAAHADYLARRCKSVAKASKVRILLPPPIIRYLE